MDWKRAHPGFYINGDRTLVIANHEPGGTPLHCWVVYPMDHNGYCQRHKPISRHATLADAKASV